MNQTLFRGMSSRISNAILVVAILIWWIGQQSSSKIFTEGLRAGFGLRS